MSERHQDQDDPQRRFHGVARKRPVVVYTEDEDSACSFVRLESVGRGGALLLCDRPIPIDTELDLAICLAGGVIRTRARVLYHVEAADGVGIGVEFLGVRGDGAELLERLATPTPWEVPLDPPPSPAD